LHAASRVTIRIDVTVVYRWGPSHCPACRHVAIRTGVQAHQIWRLVIDTFNPVMPYCEFLTWSGCQVTYLSGDDDIAAIPEICQLTSHGSCGSPTISISPPLGQSPSSVSQAAGHVPQPWGICAMSKLRNRFVNLGLLSS
jgi:hypothetical protein